MNSYPNKPIAIIGTSCRFPLANNMEEFWSLLKANKSVISTVPEDRWDMSEYYDSNKETPHKTNQNHGAFLKDIHHFDPQLFNISPREAFEMSPSQKLLLELAWEVVENSSVNYKSFTGSKTGVYIGNIWSDYEHFRKVKNAEINNFSGIGMSGNVLANRISYIFGLTGPSFVLDTGCSSSLIALMQAVEALQYGSIDMAVAGGVNHILDPEQYIYLAKFGGLSSKGKCSSFSASADGFVRAEGAGLVLLKPLEKAIEDGDNIAAVIKGGAMNNNGFNENMPATSTAGQIELLELAYKNAGVNPASVHFIEAHGTGTKLGDPVEAKALGLFMGQEEDRKSKLVIGSAKTNFGHAEGAAGMAGILKVIASIEKETIPANLNFDTPNPKIDFEGWNLTVPTENIPWPTSNGEPYRAGVSSFGWGGSNAHIILEQDKPEKTKESSQAIPKSKTTVPISARSESSLKAYAKSIATHIKNNIKSESDLATFGASFALTKPNLEYRKVIQGKNKEEIFKTLIDFSESDMVIDPAEEKSNGKPVFVFSGQGSQWIGMGQGLYKSNKTFKASFNQCHTALSLHTDWLLAEELFADEASSKLKRIDVIQPFIFAVQVSLAKMWISMGITPGAIVGHSMGEVAAAHIAGILSLEDAALIITSRSKLMHTLSGTGGAMAVTELTKEEAEKIVGQHNGKLSVAVTNSPKSTVIAGDENHIKALLAELESKDLFCKQVKVDVASHSPQMDKIKGALHATLTNLQPHKSNYPLYSTVWNKRLEGDEMDADYWTDNLRGTVQFSSIINQLLNEGFTSFIESSPHPVLKTAITECVNSFGYSGVTSLYSTYRDNNDTEEFSKNFCAFIETGGEIDWKEYYSTTSPVRMKLPPYPMDRSDYEVKTIPGPVTGQQQKSLHPLLHRKVDLAGSNAIYWQSELSLHNLPIVAGHKVNDNAVLPGGFYIEMITYALKESFPKQVAQISNLAFKSPVILSHDQADTIQLRINLSDTGTPIDFSFHRKNIINQTWDITCSGNIKLDQQPFIELDEPTKTETEYSKTDIYKGFKTLGVYFDEQFQNISSIKGDKNKTISYIKTREGIIPDATKCAINPVLLDNILHPLFSPILNSFNNNTVVSTFVTSIDEIIIADTFEKSEQYKIACKNRHINFSPNKTSCELKSDISLIGKNNEIILQCIGVEAKSIDTGIEKKQTGTVNPEDLTLAINNAEPEHEKFAIVQQHIINTIAKITKNSPDKINSNTKFKSLGIDSLTIVQLRNIFEKDFSFKCTIKDFATYSSPNAFSCFVLESILNKMSTEANTEEQDKWLIYNRKASTPIHQIFLFHDAGGSSMLFNGWEEHFPENYDVISIELPGHGNRTDEEPINNYKTAIDILKKKIDACIKTSFSFYGHSMGGLIAFETATSLTKENKEKLTDLIISGTPYLYKYKNIFVNSIIENNVSDKELQKLMPSIGKEVPQEIIDQIVKTIRADFELIHSYPYNNSSTLDCNITAIHAKDDDRVSYDSVKRWKYGTTQSFTPLIVKGEHNFVYSLPLTVTHAISQAILQSVVLKEQSTI